MQRILRTAIAAATLTAAGNAVAAPETIAFPSGCLARGAGFIAENAWARLAWQGDGNLVIYAKDGSGAKWATGTHGRGEALCFQGDGNLVVYAAGQALWASRTHQRGVTALEMTGCGFDLVNAAGEARYSVAKSCRQMVPENDGQIIAGTCFDAGAGVIAENAWAQLVFGADGMLKMVGKDGSGVKWSGNSSTGERVCFGQDGNLQVIGDLPARRINLGTFYINVAAAEDVTLWHSNTAGSGAELFDMDGCGFRLLDRAGNSAYSVARACDQVEPTSAAQFAMDGTCYPPQGTWLAQTDDLKLAWQGDGNLVIYAADGSGARWATGTHGRGRSLCLQEDGDMVIYGDGDAVLWSSDTAGARVLELTPLGILPAGAGDDLSLTAEDTVVYDADPVEEPRLIAYTDGIPLERDVIIKNPDELEADLAENEGNRFERSWERSNSFGNNEFGGGYGFGIRAFATELPQGLLYATAEAFGDTYGIVFGKQLTILGARFAAETNGFDNDSAATVTVLNIDIDVELLDREVELFSVSKTFVEKSKTFMAGPVPITVAGDLTGTLSATAELSFGATGITLTVTPQAVLTGTAQAGVGAACVSAGIRGALDLVDIQVPTSAALVVNPFDLTADLNLSSELTVSSLGGSLSLYADYCVGDAELEIVGWDGVPVASVTLVDQTYNL